MKPRARRVTLAAAVLGVGVLAVLVVVHWGVVRDHVEAWHFQLTRETVDWPINLDLPVIVAREREPRRCRVVEQRFPRRAYVVIPHGPVMETFPILW